MTMVDPTQIIRFIATHPLPSDRIGALTIYPLSTMETVNLLVLLRLGFEVGFAARTAKVKTSHAPKGTFGSAMRELNVTAFSVSGHGVDCFVDEKGNCTDAEILSARVIKDKAILQDAYFDGAWRQAMKPPDPARMAYTIEEQFIVHLAALCEAHLLQEQTPTMTASSRHRRI